MNGDINKTSISPSGSVSYFTAYDMVRMHHEARRLKLGSLDEKLPANLIEESRAELEKNLNDVVIPTLRRYIASPTPSPDHIADVFIALISLQISTLSLAAKFGLPMDAGFASIMQTIIERSNGVPDHALTPVPTLKQIVEETLRRIALVKGTQQQSIIGMMEAANDTKSTAE